MAIKTAIIPWFSGGALLLGYAAFAWLRGKRGPAQPVLDRHAAPAAADVEPLSTRLERVPEELVLDLEELEAPPSSATRRRRHSDLGASFLARATGALSPTGFNSGRGPAGR